MNLFRPISSPTIKGTAQSIWVKPKSQRQNLDFDKALPPQESRFRFITDETQLNNIEKIKYPIRVFDLKGLGFTDKEAQDFITLFSDDSGMAEDLYTMKIKQIEFLKRKLPGHEERLNGFLKDYYTGRKDLIEISDLIQQLQGDNKIKFNSIGPTRSRSIQSFDIKQTPDNNSWYFIYVLSNNYQQDVTASDYRSELREFNWTALDKTSHPLFKKFIASIAELTGELLDKKNIEKIKMTFHEVRVYAPGSPAPEGPHQDGTQIVLTAFVIERKDIDGGKSIVYNGAPSEKGTSTCIEKTLEPGQGCFHTDTGTPIWHYVTPIEKSNSTQDSLNRPSRKTLGLDIEVVLKNYN